MIIGILEGDGVSRQPGRRPGAWALQGP